MDPHWRPFADLNNSPLATADDDRGRPPELSWDDHRPVDDRTTTARTPTTTTTTTAKTPTTTTTHNADAGDAWTDDDSDAPHMPIQEFLLFLQWRPANLGQLIIVNTC